MKNYNENIILEDFLKQYNIAKDLFPSTFDLTNEDKVILKRYYDDSYSKAKILVMDDEVVGITFDNLDFIKKVLEESKLVKKM